jgi:hypothetical protein
MGFEVAWLAATADEHAATVGTGRTVSGFGLPVGGFTIERQISEHAGAQTIPAFIKSLLDLS